MNPCGRAPDAAACGAMKFGDTSAKPTQSNLARGENLFAEYAVAFLLAGNPFMGIIVLVENSEALFIR